MGIDVDVKNSHKSDQSKWRENNKQYCSNYDKQYKNKNKEAYSFL